MVAIVISVKWADRVFWRGYRRSHGHLELLWLCRMHYLSQELKLDDVNLPSRFQKQARNVYIGLGGWLGSRAPACSAAVEQREENSPAVTTQRGQAGMRNSPR